MNIGIYHKTCVSQLLTRYSLNRSKKIIVRHAQLDSQMNS